MRMARAGLLVAILLLTGCYESDQVVFPMDGGEAVPLKQGLYRCSAPNQKDERIQVTVVNDANKYRYVFKDREEKDSDTFSFYQVEDGYYIGVTPLRQSGGAATGQIIALLKWEGPVMKWLDLPDERTKELAEKNGASIGEFAYRIRGSVESQRALVHAAVKDPAAKPVISCVFESP
jgi:hypothetical protein